MTLNNVVLAIAFIIGANWAWGSIQMMQRNYTLQRTLDIKMREQTLAELENATLAFEKKYHESDEYKELAARQYLGLASEGEKVLILPPTEPSKVEGKPKADDNSTIQSRSNLKQWVDFLSGNNRRRLQD